MKFTLPALGIGLAIAAPAYAQMGMSIDPTPKAAEPAKGQSKDQVKPSSAALNAIVELQNAVNANDAANIPAKMAAAQKVAKTKEDRYIIGQLQLKAAIASKDNAALGAAIDTLAASGYLDAAKVGELYRSLGGTYFNEKQYDPAAAAYDKAIALDPNHPDGLMMLAETRNAQGRKAEAVAAFQRVLQASIAAGQKPREEIYRRTVALAYEGKLASAPELGRQWVAAYPSPDSWRNAIAIYRNLSRPDVEGTLGLLRLMQAAGALNGAADYSLFATAAADQSNFVEAQAVIDAGIAAKQVDPANPLVRDIIAGLKTKPKTTAADLDAAVKMAKDGTGLVRIGDRYYGLGQYAKAAELYRSALGKGNVDANIANLHLGMALARSGDKAGATAAFNAVTGPRADIAKYWLLYLQLGA
jgi:tetratricopeptide (TPR) repeat protein